MPDPEDPLRVPFHYGEVPYAEWLVPYDQVEPLFQTGDLILQHGEHSEISVGIGMIQNSYWGHIGMVAKASDLGIDRFEGWLYLESNTPYDETLDDYLQDPPAPKKEGGPMAVDLRKRLEHNEGQEGRNLGIAYRRLREPLRADQIERLRPWVDGVHDKIFTDDAKSGMTILGKWMYARVSNEVPKPPPLFPDPNDYMFCSELVAGAYQAMGLLTDHWIAPAYTPKDFSPDGRVPLFANQLEPAMRIDPDTLKP